MSKATLVLRDRLPPEELAQWWRMAFNATEEVLVNIENEDDPGKVTVGDVDVPRRPRRGR
jgi:hypothetical protein